MTTATALTPSQTDETLAYLYDQRSKLSRQIKAERTSFCPNQQRIDTLLNEQYTVSRDIKEYEERYERQPWSRYFRVTNGNGHIHSSTHCATCFPTTQFAWLTGLSSAAFERVIEDYGCKVCSVCFPQAPVDPRYSQPGRLDRKAQARRTAEKAQRRSAKLEKALLPDGSALRVRVSGFEERVETVVTAERLLVEALFENQRARDLRYNGGSRISFDRLVEIQKESDAAQETLAQALAAKRGTDADEVRRSVSGRVARKVKQWEKEGRW